MQIFRYAEQGSIELLWISATNPAVSLPDLARIRRILARDELFVVVQDLFLTETARARRRGAAAATWGEKTGTFTNADRTVHLSEQAVEPPGEARADLDIFLDYARRMDFRDRDGAPLITWDDPEAAFEAWKALLARAARATTPASATTACAAAAASSGRAPQRRPTAPSGSTPTASSTPTRTTARPTGRTSTTGAADDRGGVPARRQPRRPRVPARRATTSPSPEVPDDEYPLLLTTGRTVYHFHTRTKTGRAPELDAAAPDVVGRAQPDDARRARHRRRRPRAASSRRAARRGAGAAHAASGPGVVFVPFHYGYWDADGAGPDAAARRQRAHDHRLGPGLEAADVQGRRRARRARVVTDVHLAHYLGLLHRAQRDLADAFREVADAHARRPDVFHLCQRLAEQCDAHAERLAAVRRALRRGRAATSPTGCTRDLFPGTRTGGARPAARPARPLPDGGRVRLAWTLVGQAAQGARDAELLDVVQACEGETAMQLKWLGAG